MKKKQVEIQCKIERQYIKVTLPFTYRVIGYVLQTKRIDVLVWIVFLCSILYPCTNFQLSLNYLYQVVSGLYVCVFSLYISCSIFSLPTSFF